MMLWSELESGTTRPVAAVISANRPGGRKERHQAQTAYTLVEVMVAVFLVAIIAGAFYAALASGFGLVQANREDLRATQIMMQKLEGVRLCTWSELSNFSFTDVYDPSGGKAGTAFAGTVTVGPANSIPNSSSYAGNMCLVTVTVSWTNYNGKVPVPHTRQMQTQVARYGLQNYIWGAIQ
jgi:prepilin-type N-terminal cleavage/methylation domain-containing protein